MEGRRAYALGCERNSSAISSGFTDSILFGGHFRRVLDLAFRRPGDREAVALFVIEFVVAVEMVRSVSEVEAVVRAGEPVLEVLDGGGGGLVGAERLVEPHGGDPARELRFGDLRPVLEGDG